MTQTTSGQNAHKWKPWRASLSTTEVDAAYAGGRPRPAQAPRVVPDDPEDDKLVAAALAAGAALVSNDAHLLALAGHAGLEVVRPADVRAW